MVQFAEADDSQVDDFEAELLADLEDDQEFEACDEPPLKRQRQDAPATPDVSEATWSRQSQGLLGQLPPEVVLRLFGFLSADDLTAAAKACRYLGAVTAQDELWKRLYCARWPLDFHLQSCQGSTWKKQYMGKDLMEMSNVLKGVPDSLQPIFKEMEVSKRSLTLGREHAGQNITLNGGRHRHSPVTQWRVEHGFSEQPDPNRICSGRCSFVNVSDNIYLCEACGREHVCDEHCGERVLDTANGLPVCPISGMCFDHQLDAAWEEDSDGKGDDTIEWGDEGTSLAGRLGQAYVAGYNCNTEEELQQVCGFRSFRT